MFQWHRERLSSCIELRRREDSEAVILDVLLAPLGVGPALPGFTPDHRHLVIPNEHSDNVFVFGLESLSIEGQIPLTKGSRPWQAKTIPAAGNLAYVTNSRFSGDAGTCSLAPSTVSIVDISRMSIIGEILVGSGPNGVTVDRQSRRGYVMNMRSNTVSVIDVMTHKVIAVISVGAGPAFGKLTNDGRTLVVTNLASSSVSIIDTDTLEVTNEIVVGVPYKREPFPQWGPGDTTGIAITEHKTAFITNYRSHSIVILDLVSGRRNDMISPLQFPFFVEVDRLNDRVIFSSGIEKRFAIWDVAREEWLGVYDIEGIAEFNGALTDFNLWMTLPTENRIRALLPQGLEGISRDWERNIVTKFL